MKGDFSCPNYRHSQRDCWRIATKAVYTPPTATTGNHTLTYIRPEVICMGNPAKCEIKNGGAK